MTHFSILIIGENPENQLEPFWELDLDIDEMIKDERAVFKSSFKIEDLEKKFEEFKEKNKEDIKKGGEKFWVKYMTCSAQKWMDDWSGDYLNEEKTEYGYYHNPKAKWDWHLLGGRWTGVFKLKKGSKGKVGKRGLTTPSAKGTTCDQAKKKDIDFSPDKEKYKKAIQFWELYVEGREPSNEEEEELIEYTIYKKEYFLEKYKTKENYAKTESEFTTWAVLKDGEWFEAGEMGWFGMNSATTKEEADFQEGFYDKFIKSLHEDTLLSVFDCHI